MDTPTFWALLYSTAIPVACVAIVWVIVRETQERYGEPKLEGRLLLRADTVRAQSAGLPGAPPYRMWITDREIVLRLRPGYKARLKVGIETRIPVSHVAYVLQLPDGKIRLGLTGGEGRHWDISSDEPVPLARALDALPLASSPVTSQ